MSPKRKRIPVYACTMTVLSNRNNRPTQVDARAILALIKNLTIRYTEYSILNRFVTKRLNNLLLTCHPKDSRPSALQMHNIRLIEVKRM
jgi:hypothetical protein